MNRAGLSSAVLLSTVYALACDGGDEMQKLEAPPTVYGDDNLVTPRPLIAKGCLTTSGNRFVLTELEPGAAGPRVAERRGEKAWAEPQPTTEVYRLVGMEDDLRPLVGRHVEISGDYEPERVVDIRKTTPALASDGDARVTTVETAHVKIGDLRVWSVHPTGDRCAAPNE